jgi:3-hydroxy-9,10-secoandrosta-1,3,5(10)-triene-9,17-dione monooxygenase
MQSETDERLIAQVRELIPLLAANASKVESDRRISEDNVEALDRLGLFKLMVPKRWGGYEASPATVLRVGAELAKGCAATAWVQVIIEGSSWMASLLPDAGQEEIFASGAPRVCGVITPTATSRNVAGGYLVSGRWSFASGCQYASWAALAIPLVDRAGNVTGMGLAFVPTAQLTIEDTWFMSGMSGTGSNTLVGNEIFVPEERLLSLEACLAGEFPGKKYSGALSDRWAFVPALALSLAGPMLGAAEAALKLATDGTHKRGITYTHYARQIDSQVVHRDIAEATLKIQGAWLYAERAANEIARLARAGLPMDYISRARIRGECGFIGKLLREAVDQIVSISGAPSFAQTSAIQRHWRDINVATRHPHLSAATNLELYGHALLGLPDNIDRGV